MNTQKTELDSIRRKIKALTQKTTENGCSEHEALSAMALVGQLLQQYNLSMSEIDVREQKCTTIFIPLQDRQRRHPIDGCIVALTALFEGKVWFKKTWKKHEDDTFVVKNGRYVKEVSYAFFIQEQDADTIRYLFDVIFQAIETEAEAFKNQNTYKETKRRKLAYVSFQKGMASRVADRLRAIKAENDAAQQAAQAAGHSASSTGTSLIVLKGQLIEEEFKQLNMKLIKNYNRSRSHWDAYAAGHKAGDKVNLNRPLGNDQHNGGYLT